MSFKRNRPVENQLAGRAVFVQRKIGEALELIAQFRLRVFQARLAFGRHHFQRVRVEHGFEIASVLLRLGFGEQPVVKAALRRQSRARRSPNGSCL